MNRDDDGFTAEERAALREFERQEAPPELRDMILGRLREAGLVDGRARGSRRWPRTIVGIAASLLIFAAGHWSAGLGGATDRLDGERWLLLLHGGGSSSEAEHREHATSMRNWARNLVRSGVQVDGSALADEGWMLGEDAGQSPSDASGFFLLEGVDDVRAREISESCPHLRLGGSVELRRLRS